MTLLAINNSRTKPASVDLPTPAERYTLTAQKLEDVHVQLNGRELKLEPNDALPSLQAAGIPPGRAEVAPASITFFAVADAGNGNCR